MKALSVLVLTLFASLSFGLGKVGDLAVYDLKVEVEGKVLAGETSNEVMKYDETTKKYTVRNITVVNGQPEIRESQVEQLFTPEVAARVVDGCATPLETVVVPAGTFKTCKVYSTDSDNTMVTVWVAKVPFAVVKADTENDGQATNVHMELKSFKDAQ